MIFETQNFTVKAVEEPFVDRDEGGHIRVDCKIAGVKDRTHLTPAQAVECARLLMLTGEAYKIAMKNRGVDIIRMNYQDMGNWYYKYNHPEALIINIFGRVLGCKHQPFPEAVYLPDRSTGFYDNFKPITAEDEKEIQKQMNLLLKTSAKYSKELWRI